MSVVLPNPDSPREKKQLNPTSPNETRKPRTNDHNGEVPTTFSDNLMPLFDASVYAAAGSGEKILTNLVREVGNANAVERRCRVGHWWCVGQRRLGATGTLTSKKFKLEASCHSKIV